MGLKTSSSPESSPDVLVDPTIRGTKQFYSTKEGSKGLFVFLWKKRGLRKEKPGHGAVHLRIVINLTTYNLTQQHRWSASKSALPVARNKTREGGPELGFRRQCA